MPWVETQHYPYGPKETEWVEGWTERQLAPYASPTRVYETSPGEYIIPGDSQEFGTRGNVQRFE